jgi:hypothetical protein
MIRDQYRMQLAEVPPGGTRVTVLVLEPWQAALDRLVAELLTDRQWQALDDAVIQNLANTLHDETADHLKGT